MKRRHVLVLVALTAFTTSGFAQEPPTKGKTVSKDQAKATHDELREVLAGVTKAIKEKDVDGLIAFLHPDVVVTTQDNKEQKAIRKHAGVRDFLSRMVSGPKAVIKTFEPNPTADEETILYDGDFGVAYGSSKDHYVLADGTAYDLPSRWSATLVKHDGKWKVASLHFSMNLFENPALDAATKLMYIVGGIAAAVGFVLGLIVMKLLSRKA